MNVIDNKVGISIASAEDVMDMEEREALEAEGWDEDDDLVNSSLSAHILSVFQDNKDARNTSGIDQKMLESLRAYNGHYDPEDLARIRATKGSEIFMNLTPTKCRAAMSWIRDILLPAMADTFSFEPTPLPEIPEEIKEQLREKIEKYLVDTSEGNENPTNVTNMLKEQNQLQADVEEAIQAEIVRVAKVAVKVYQTKVADELMEGNWVEALSDFIEDFCVFQVAVMKGPIVTPTKKFTWVDGQPVEVEDYIYLNKRVSPLDIYPSPSSTSIEDGDLCEHIRLRRKDLYGLIGIEGYDEETIREILRDTSYGREASWVDTYIENEKTIEEYRGDEYKANTGIYHGIHYHGTASWKQLDDYGYSSDVIGDDEEREFDIEAILVGDKIIKAIVKDSPMLKRPYYKACFQNIPGSFWGRSLPELMRDIQRLCNATARALANNMGVASGPQVQVNIDRLAADEEIESIYPFKIWQTTNDLTGNSGRAVDFFQPTSNAAELLAVYNAFEQKADDATGIPRYAYGNENVGGAAQTASGMSMLLETASKGIKDAIGHIDNGLIIPRVEYQFYYNMLTDPDAKFTGDVKVVAKGSQALTMKGAQEMRRNEFLQILSQPSMVSIVGMEGIAEILREMSKALGLGADIVPSRVELRYKQQQAAKAQAEAQKQAQEMEAQKQSVGIQQVGMQTEQAEKASQRNAELKAADLELKGQKVQTDAQLKQANMELQFEIARLKEEAKAQTKMQDLAQKDRAQNKSIALSVNSQYQDKAQV